MSDSHGRVSVAKAPVCDYADGLKWMYNGVSCLRERKYKLTNNQDVYIIGSGKYSGAETDKWVDQATRKLLYFSYRNCFAPLANGSTTDLSWGCMYRAAQMLLAHAFMRFFNGGVARIDVSNIEKLREQTQVLFMDVPEAPFGIHALTTECENHGMTCGKWVGPTPMANTLASLAALRLSAGDGPVVLSIPSREVNIDEIMAHLWRSRHVLILIPVMLGGNAIKKEYAELLIQCFKMESFAGVLGGSRGSAFFFIGNQEDKMLYLDPHTVQRAFARPASPGVLACNKCVISVNECDTSMAICFYISSPESFCCFQNEIEKANAGLPFPLISLTRGQREVQPFVSDMAEFVDLMDDQ